MVEENPANKVAVERLAELEGEGSVPAAEAQAIETPPVVAADTESDISEESSEFVEIDLDSDEPPPSFAGEDVESKAAEDEVAEQAVPEPALRPFVFRW